MLKLFAIMKEVGLEVDASNDDLNQFNASTEDGFNWSVPLLAVPPEFPHASLARVGVRTLGDVFRGYVYHPINSWQMQGPSIELYLSAEYEDQQDTEVSNAQA